MQWEPRELAPEEREVVTDVASHLANTLSCRDALVERLGSDPNLAVRQLVRVRGGSEELKVITSESLGLLDEGDDPQIAMDWLVLNSIEHALLRLHSSIERELQWMERVFKAYQADVGVTSLSRVLALYKQNGYKLDHAAEVEIRRIAKLLDVDHEQLCNILEYAEVIRALQGNPREGRRGKRHGPVDAAKVAVSKVIEAKPRTLDHWRDWIRRVMPFMDLDDAESELRRDRRTSPKSPRKRSGKTAGTVRSKRARHG